MIAPGSHVSSSPVGSFNAINFNYSLYIICIQVSSSSWLFIGSICSFRRPVFLKLGLKGRVRQSPLLSLCFLEMVFYFSQCRLDIWFFSRLVWGSFGFFSGFLVRTNMAMITLHGGSWARSGDISEHVVQYTRDRAIAGCRNTVCQASGRNPSYCWYGFCSWLMATYSLVVSPNSLLYLIDSQALKPMIR